MVMGMGKLLASCEQEASGTCIITTYKDLQGHE